ncbi:hypothetical protein K450DRAFT_189940 [Umbelopsis ramanniana AG]|uniref:Peptidase A1 domain-containing protein n=1 Tax=Umbelopsis ramanniana AG TaxID=1314678 RepID=A0AAD5E7G7_UMBRA|nr:uncharacterized protein K450DRAFT_189940 [Umbelopsis ramanniana AG]KAI8578332.1 hypothetical protein K450DRAFT_189940 [Umbelopsis ramanniana AG]
MTVSIGNPATEYNLIVDTGSANTVVGASKIYKVTSTSSDLSSTFEVAYEGSQVSGKLYKDSVTLSPSLAISQQIIGVATQANGIDSVDGILGLGPVDLSLGTSSNQHNIPTVVDNLFAQGTMNSNEFALSFRPCTGASVKNGYITFGGIDSGEFTGAITYTPVTQTSPASTFWGIDASVDYGAGKTSILKTTAGIVDSSTSLLLLATDAFKAYQAATGGVLDSVTGLLSVTSDQYNALQSLYFNIAGEVYELAPNAQIFPRGLNSQIGGESGKIYLIVSDLRSPSGSGLDFILGKAFLERFYVAFDTTNRRIGFATTEHTLATTN